VTLQVCCGTFVSLAIDAACAAKHKGGERCQDACAREVTGAVLDVASATTLVSNADSTDACVAGACCAAACSRSAAAGAAGAGRSGGTGRARCTRRARSTGRARCTRGAGRACASVLWAGALHDRLHCFGKRPTRIGARVIHVSAHGELAAAGRAVKVVAHELWRTGFALKEAPGFGVNVVGHRTTSVGGCHPCHNRHQCLHWYLCQRCQAP
jgi:hypothetical protein